MEAAEVHDRVVPLVAGPVSDPMAARAGVDAARVAKLRTFFARASVATRLLQSRLALPIAYPLNTAMMREGQKLKEPPGGGWSQEEIERGLAHAMPIVTGMAKVAPLLKAAQALNHYQGAHQRTTVPDAATEEDPDVRLDTLRPPRIGQKNYGKGPGHKVTKTGDRWGWEEAGTGRPVDSALHRKTSDPFEDTPELHTRAGRKFVSRTKWDKRKSGSQ